MVNEAYTGTAVWGKTNEGKKSSDPVRVEGAWPAIVSRELFSAVGQAMRERAPAMRPPARVGSKLMREGAGACESRYLNAPRVEGFVVDKIKERILTDETITELVTLVAEEVDRVAGELGGKLEAIEGELADVRKRLSRLYEALETSDLTMEVLSPRIYSMRHREEQLMAAQEDLSRQLEKRRVDLPSTEEIREYVKDFREFRQQDPFPERKALIRNFVQEIEVIGDQATLTYTVPMPSDGATMEETSVLYFANSGLLSTSWNGAA